MKQDFSLHNPQTQTSNDETYRREISEHFEGSSGTSLEKLNNFPRFVSRQALSLFLAKHEMFKKVLSIHGNIVECGVFMGGGLFSWAQLSAVYEPVNHNRRVIGFDTFEGLSGFSDKDQATTNGETLEAKRDGGYAFPFLEELQENAAIFDKNRPVGHIPKIELIKGNACETIPAYVEDNPHLIVSLLYLDFDLYEPTLAALKAFVPRMPRGAVIGFDELNQKTWPGETQAVLEELGINSLRIERFPFTPSVSFAVID